MNDEIFNDDYYSGDYDSYEYKLEQLKKKLTENKPPKKTDTMKKSKRDEDNEDDYDEDGEKVREHPVTRGDEEEYAQNKKKWKVMHDTELLLKKLRHKLALTGNFETFSEMLFRLIGEKKIKPSDCYKRANVDRRLFYKIKHKKYYAPTKNTVLAFAVALKLEYREAEIFLKSAGYAFSDNIVTDVIVSHFIKRRVYRIDRINEALYAYGQPLLGLK